jgi:hypothetical protein
MTASPPTGLTIERQLHKSLLISWKAPVVEPESIRYYLVYVNGILRYTIKANEGTRALVEGLQMDKVNIIYILMFYISTFFWFSSFFMIESIIKKIFF